MANQFNPLDQSGDRHVYRTPDGRTVPSVTQVLKAAGLIDTTWYTGDRAALGRIVHEACQYHDEGDLDQSSLAQNVGGYLEAWKSFRAASGFEPIAGDIERSQIAELAGMRYGMTLDRTGRVDGTRQAVVDIKTGDPEPWHGIQLAAYVAGRSVVPSATIRLCQRLAVHLRADGAYAVRAYDDTNDLDIFQAALAIAWWRINHGLWRD